MTNVEQAWWKFLRFMKQTPAISSIKKTVIAGLPFVYIEKNTDNSRTSIEEVLKTGMSFAIKGKRLTPSMTFVRENETQYIYRIRFLVPQQKMFCCGHGCDNCIQFTVNH